MTAPATSRIIPKTNSPAETMTVRAAIGSPHLRGGRTRPASGPTRGRPGTEDQPQVGTPDGVPQQVRKERLDPVRSEARQERTDVDPECSSELLSGRSPWGIESKRLGLSAEFRGR